MISLTGLMGKITGKAVPAGEALRLPGAESGIATGGDFAALVARVTQAGVPPRQAELPLVPGKSPASTDASAPDFAGLPAGDALPTFADIVGAMPVAAEQPIAAGPAQLPDLPVEVPNPIKPKITGKPEGDIAVSDVAEAPVELVQADGQPETTKESRDETPSAPSPQQPVVALATVAIAAIVPQQVLPAAPVPASAPEAAKAATAAQPMLASAASLPGLRAAAAGEKPKVDAKAGPAAPNASVPATEAFTSGDTGAAPTSGAPADEPLGRAHAPATAAPAIAAGTSLRAIVDGLPPVIQSELAAAPVSVVTGPSTGQQLGDQVIDMGVSGQWIDRMAREIAGLADGNGHSRFTLNPPHLGRLEINLWQDQGATSLRMIADTDEGARRLSEGRGALQADARIASLNLSAITIEKASSSGDAARDHQRSGGEPAAQMQQQAGGQGQGQPQTRAGNGQQQGEWVSRFAREDITQQSDAPAPAPAPRAADATVRFA